MKYYTSIHEKNSAPSFSRGRNILNILTKKLEGCCNNSSVVKNTESELTKAVVALTLLTMKSRIFKDFNFSLDRHDEGIISALVKTNEKFNIATLDRSTKLVDKVILVLLTVTKFKQVMKVYAKDISDRSSVVAGIIDIRSYLV